MTDLKPQIAGISPLTLPPDQAAISQLEELLMLARQGRLRQFTAIAIMDNAPFFSVRPVTEINSLAHTLGTLELLRAQLLKAVGTTAPVQNGVKQ